MSHYQLRRTFNATPEQVFRFFVEPEPFSQWFVVPGFRTESVQMDARPGRSVQAIMVADDNNTELPFTVQYGDVEPPHRVVLRPGDDEEVTITLSPTPDGTELTYDYTGPAAGPADQSAVDTMLDQIARHL
ncbi:SRPBCC family protein [Kribbella sp. CA-253562]|uniref:SRPBCC family protein n=1 Tax=Kribbella sp. CA-253562 TaxID=3239942 RepID=UPI003D8B3F3B